MRVLHYSNLINAAFTYVINTSIKYNIDESYSLKHSMDVFHIANEIYNNELIKHPYLEDDKTIIELSAILHDMCDKKYVDESTSMNDMCSFIQNHDINNNDINIISRIISSMSYSTVKKRGFADIPNHQLAYHIVREADLLSAYDPDRCIIYGMMREKLDYIEATKRAVDLLENRVLKYIDDNLFVTEYSKQKAIELHKECEKKIMNLKTIF